MQNGAVVWSVTRSPLNKCRSSLPPWCNQQLAIQSVTNNERMKDSYFSLDRERDRLLRFSFLSRSRSLDFLPKKPFVFSESISDLVGM